MGSFPKNNKKIEAWGNSVMDYWTHHISILATELKPAGCGGYAMQRPRVAVTMKILRA